MIMTHKVNYIEDEWLSVSNWIIVLIEITEKQNAGQILQDSSAEKICLSSRSTCPVNGSETFTNTTPVWLVYTIGSIQLLFERPGKYTRRMVSYEWVEKHVADIVY